MEPWGWELQGGVWPGCGLRVGELGPRVRARLGVQSEVGSWGSGRGPGPRMRSEVRELGPRARVRPLGCGLRSGSSGSRGGSGSGRCSRGRRQGTVGPARGGSLPLPTALDGV